MDSRELEVLALRISAAIRELKEIEGELRTLSLLYSAPVFPSSALSKLLTGLESRLGHARRLEAEEAAIKIGDD